MEAFGGLVEAFGGLWRPLEAFEEGRVARDRGVNHGCVLLCVVPRVKALVVSSTGGFSTPYMFFFFFSFKACTRGLSARSIGDFFNVEGVRRRGRPC